MEWASTALSFTGTAMVAKHVHGGWWLCLAAEVGFVVFAVRKRLWGFLALCGGYAVLNLVGALS